MTDTPTYPKRPKFFAAKFCRLVVKACVANELGPEAAMLLVAVANTEDARGYRGPVNFWNGQLCPLIGCKSDSTLKRIRAKCQAAGWLVCDPGSRAKPPVYFVTVPAHFEGWDDAPTDDGTADLKTDSAQMPPASRPDSAHQWAASEREVGEMRATSFPVPVPKEEDPLPPEVEPAGKPRPDDVIAAWNATPGLPAFKGTNPNLRRDIGSRWADPRFRERWRDVLAALAKSDWHTGRSADADSFVATLTWFVSERGWDKAFAVLERQDALTANRPPPRARRLVTAADDIHNVPDYVPTGLRHG